MASRNIPFCPKRQHQSAKINVGIQLKWHKNQYWDFTRAAHKSLLEFYQRDKTIYIRILLKWHKKIMLRFYRSGNGVAGSIFGGFSLASSFCLLPKLSHPLHKGESKEIFNELPNSWNKCTYHINLSPSLSYKSRKKTTAE